MKNIGGFFELEIAQGKSLFHDKAIKLSTGRACLSLLLEVNTYNKIYVPYYCCDALFEPMDLYGINYEFYSINDKFEINDKINLKPNEALIYCNFFGIKSSYVNQLILEFGKQLIIDNSHAFYIKNYKNNASFTTARKYFGVPDGAFLYSPLDIESSSIPRKKTISVNHSLHRLLGLQDQAFNEFQEYENSLNSKIERISLFSEKVLKTLDYNKVRDSRNNNFSYYRERLDSINTLTIHSDAKDCFCYPLLLEEPIDKKLLHKEKIFIPTYWVDVLNRNIEDYEKEKKFSNEILPLPIDHRYDSNDLERVIKTIKKIING